MTTDCQPGRDGGRTDLLEHPARIVALSGGKDSTALALRLMEVEPKPYQFCITPTGRELPEMVEHWAKLGCLLGSPLLRIPGPSGQQCALGAPDNR